MEWIQNQNKKKAQINKYFMRKSWKTYNSPFLWNSTLYSEQTLSSALW